MTAAPVVCVVIAKKAFLMFCFVWMYIFAYIYTFLHYPCSTDAEVRQKKKKHRPARRQSEWIFFFFFLSLNRVFGTFHCWFELMLSLWRFWHKTYEFYNMLLLKAVCNCVMGTMTYIHTIILHTNCGQARDKVYSKCHKVVEAQIIFKAIIEKFNT